MYGAKMEEVKHDSKEFAHFSFDIFQVEAEGVVWREAAPTFAEASKRVQELAHASPADYIVWNRKTGEKHKIKPDDRLENARVKRAHS